MEIMRILGAICVVLLLAGSGQCGNSNKISVNGDVLSELEFVAPENPVDRKYLGLPEGKKFRLPQVKAKLLVIELFSMYCPVCQRDAQAVNEFYSLLKKIPGLQDDVKMLGIGSGNTPYEVKVFREKFNIQFPLVPDDNFVVQKALSDEIRTPTFLVAKIAPGGKLEIILSKVGEIKESGEFLKMIMKKFN